MLCLSENVGAQCTSFVASLVAASTRQFHFRGPPLTVAIQSIDQPKKGNCLRTRKHIFGCTCNTGVCLLEQRKDVEMPARGKRSIYNCVHGWSALFRWVHQPPPQQSIKAHARSRRTRRNFMTIRHATRLNSSTTRPNSRHDRRGARHQQHAARSPRRAHALARGAPMG